MRSCKMVLWPIRARVLFELFFKRGIENGSHLFKAMGHEKNEVIANQFFLFETYCIHAGMKL